MRSNDDINHITLLVHLVYGLMGLAPYIWHNLKDWTSPLFVDINGQSEILEHSRQIIHCTIDFLAYFAVSCQIHTTEWSTYIILFIQNEK